MSPQHRVISRHSPATQKQQQAFNTTQIYNKDSETKQIAADYGEQKKLNLRTNTTS
jgi:hypothetical protein